MKVSELTGAELDYWVAKAGHPLVAGLEFELRGDHYAGTAGAEGVCCIICEKGVPRRIQLCREYELGPQDEFSPSTQWAQGGPIIERERISFTLVDYGKAWGAGNDGGSPLLHGSTPLVAAMRCYVASKYGEEVPDKPGT